MSGARKTLRVSKPTIVDGEWCKVPTVIYMEGNRIVREIFVTPTHQVRHA